MRSSLSLCPLWALWAQETRSWGTWENSDFCTFRNPAKIRASEWPRFKCRGVLSLGLRPTGGPLPILLRSPRQLLSCFFWSDFIDFLGFPGGSAVINLPAVQEIWVPSLSQEDALEKEMATHSSILAWEIHGHRSLVGYSPWVHKESDTT